MLVDDAGLGVEQVLLLVSGAVGGDVDDPGGGRERSLAAEFPAELPARDVLTAIGNGGRTWKGIQAELTGDDGRQIADSSLTNALRRLEGKRVTATDVPLSARSGARDKRYRVADPYPRFYLPWPRRSPYRLARLTAELIRLP